MASEAKKQAPDPALKGKIDEWFFNHFHQQVVLNNPDVFERAKVAKEDLLRLLGVEQGE